MDRTQKPDYFLDITREVCPMTFVKTKLLLEKVEEGSVIEVRLKGDEPLRNVPRSVEEMGHQVLEKRAEFSAAEADVHVLYIRKNPSRT